MANNLQDLWENSQPVEAPPVEVPRDDPKSLWDQAKPVTAVTPPASSAHRLYNPPTFRDILKGGKKAVSDIGSGLVQGAKDIPLALGQALTEGAGDQYGKDPRSTLLPTTISPQRIEAFNKKVADLEKKSDIHSWPGFVGRMIGQGAALLAIPESEFAKAENWLVRAGESSRLGGLVGASQPTSKKGERGENIAGGQIAGGLTSAAISGVGKFWNALKTPIENEMDILSRHFNIRTSRGESLGNDAMRAKEQKQTGSMFGGWMRDFRAKQFEDQKKAISTYLGDFVAGGGDKASLDKFQNLSESHEYVDALYKDLQEKVNQETTKRTESMKAPQAFPIYDFFNKPELDMGKTRQSLLDLEKKYNNPLAAFGNKDVNAFMAKLIGTPEDRSTGMLNQKGSTFGPGKFTFNEVWEFRKDIGSVLGQARKLYDNGKIDDSQLHMLTKLYANVSSDIDTWADRIKRPDIKDAFKEANNAYKQYIVKLKVIQSAVDKSVKGTDIEKVNLFTNALDKITKDEHLHNLFSKDEVNEMKGFVKILYNTRAAASEHQAPKVHGFSPWVGIAAVGEAAALIGVPRYGAEGLAIGAAGAGGLGAYSLVQRFLTTTPTGKALARSASRMDLTTKGGQAFMDTVYRQAAKWGASIATHPHQPLNIDNSVFNQALTGATGGGSSEPQ